MNEPIIVSGSLFDAKEKYIVHQCNCVTSRAAHLAKDMFQRFPYSDIYTPRKEPDTLGSIIVKGNGQDQRYVINLLGQYYPGKPKYPDSKKDGTKVREAAFLRGLKSIHKIKDLESVAFPFKIGCGAAGGDWNKYFEMICKLAKNTTAKVAIYKLEQ